jgi:hypothetical protein
VAAAERRLDVKYLGVHLEKWGLVGKAISYLVRRCRLTSG